MILHIWSDIDVVKKDPEISRHFLAIGKPDLVSGYGTAATRNGLVAAAPSCRLLIAEDKGRYFFDDIKRSESDGLTRNKRDIRFVIAVMGEIILAVAVGFSSAILETRLPNYRRTIAIVANVLEVFV